MLGNDCNLQCVYCCQRQVKERQIPRKISPKFWEFFHSMPAHTRVIFFGGEPLLYFGAIKEIMSHRSDLDYGVITNGKLLNERMVEWFNEYNVAITVSWDGDCSSYTRGYNVLRDNPNIQHIKSLGISAVMTKWNSPCEVLDQAKKYLPNTEYGVNFDLPLNFTDIPAEYEQVDTTKLYDDMSELTNKFIYLKTDSHESSVIESVLRIIKSHCTSSRCGNGTTTLNIDLNGNLYNCHNESTPGYYTEEWDKTVNRRKGMCAKCTMLPFCAGGCPMMSDKAAEVRCKTIHAYYEGVIDALYKNYGGIPC